MDQIFHGSYRYNTRICTLHNRIRKALYSTATAIVRATNADRDGGHDTIANMLHTISATAPTFRPPGTIERRPWRFKLNVSHEDRQRLPAKTPASSLSLPKRCNGRLDTDACGFPCSSLRPSSSPWAWRMAFGVPGPSARRRPRLRPKLGPLVDAYSSYRDMDGDYCRASGRFAQTRGSRALYSGEMPLRARREHRRRRRPR